jgi:hypothetical protein
MHNMIYLYAGDEILYAQDEIFPSRIRYMFMQEIKYFMHRMRRHLLAMLGEGAGCRLSCQI